MSGAIEKLEGLEKKLQDMEGGLNSLFQSSEVLAGRLMSLEQSLSSLSKTVQAVVSELIEKQTISSDAVMARLRKQEDDQQRARIQQMVDRKLIQASESVNEQSLVIVSTAVIDLEQNSQVTVLADYYAVEMPAQYVREPLKAQLLGKKVGDTYEEKAGATKVVLTTVKEIYNLVEGERPGEVAPVAEPAPESIASQSTETAELPNK